MANLEAPTHYFKSFAASAWAANLDLTLPTNHPQSIFETANVANQNVAIADPTEVVAIYLGSQIGDLVVEDFHGTTVTFYSATGYVIARNITKIKSTTSATITGLVVFFKP